MNKPISQKISEIRKARSLTQEQLGAKLGISSQAVSKWEKGESMPDIMLLPSLCEILGITADALLEVPISAEKESCMSSLSKYAKEVGESKALFEAIQACSCVTSDWKGSAQTGHNGIRINNTRGLGVVISGKEMVDTVKTVDIDTIKKICELLCNENAMKVFRVLDFSEPFSEEDIALQSDLEPDKVNSAIFALMKWNICEGCIDGRFLLGVQAYVIFAILVGMYFASSDGHKDIYSVSRNIEHE